MATDFTVDRDTVKYVLNSSGDISSVAIDTPAIEYNTDGTYKGLLVEPASTNICKQSEDIGTTWGTGNATPTAVTDETPDGDTSSKYIKLADDNTGGGATGSVYILQTITVVGGAQYTASAFLKKDGLDWARLQAFATGGTDNSPGQYFDLDTGALGSATAGIQDATIEAYPNGWYRCSMTWTQGAGDTSFQFAVLVAEADNDTTVDLDGTSSIFVWGAQVEASPIATSYIPTTTASVTRNKDDINLTGASDLIGQGEGTLYVEVDWRRASGQTQGLLFVSGTATPNENRIQIEVNDPTSNLSMIVRISGTTEVFQGQSFSGYSGIQKIAFAYANQDFELYRNGSSISSNTAGSLAALGTLTVIDLGQSYNASQQANMWIRAVALYKTRLTDDQLADLTS